MGSRLSKWCALDFPLAWPPTSDNTSGKATCTPESLNPPPKSAGIFYTVHFSQTLAEADAQRPSPIRRRWANPLPTQPHVLLRIPDYGFIIILLDINTLARFM
jgi:hypothetical protein